MKGYIYCHISPSNKKYIGKTEQSLTSRWANGKGYNSCPVFKKAIDKYGWDNFQHLVLEEIKSDSKEELQKNLNKKEQEYIKKYNTIVPNGYNLTAGGEGTSTFSISEEESKQIYLIEKKGIYEIAKIKKCRSEVIKQRLEEYQIPIRSKSDVQKIKINYNDLYEWYVTQKLSIPEIACLAKCSKSTVYNSINRYCLNRRQND